MRTLARLLALLVTVALVGGCAASSDSTWIHPDTGSVPPGPLPHGSNPDGD